MESADGSDPVEYEMLARGIYLPADLSAVYSGRPAELDGSLRRAIDDEWPGRVARARQEGVELTNGSLLRLVAYEDSGTALRLELGDTTYSEFLGTNCTPERHRLIPWKGLSNPLGTSALILTGDGQLILGLRGGAVLHFRNQIHTIGGMVERVDLVDGRVDATRSILREVQEELGLDPQEPVRVVCRGLMRELEHLQPELLFEVEVERSAAELEALWKDATSRFEHSSLMAILDESSAITEFIGSHPGMAPQARAALDLRLGS